MTEEDEAMEWITDWEYERIPNLGGTATSHSSSVHRPDEVFVHEVTPSAAAVAAAVVSVSVQPPSSKKQDASMNIVMMMDDYMDEDSCPLC